MTNLTQNYFLVDSKVIVLSHPRSGKDYEVSVELVRNSIGEPQCDIENMGMISNRKTKYSIFAECRSYSRKN